MWPIEKFQKYFMHHQHFAKIFRESCKNLPPLSYVLNVLSHTSQFSKDFIKNYNEESDEGYFIEFNVQYLAELHKLHNDLPFLQERIKTEKFEKHVANLHDKTDYVVHIRNLKQPFNYGLVLERVHRFIKFNQNASLKPYIEMNTDLKKLKK